MNKKISVVMTTRNDNYGGHMFDSLRFNLRIMSLNFDEVILVDFGSKEPINTILLNEKFTSTRKNVRLINIPREWVLANLYADDNFFNDILGRNIGLRRATNEYLASSNVDIVPAALSEFDFNQTNDRTFCTANKFHIELSLLQSLEKMMTDKEIQEYLIKHQHEYYREPLFHRDPWSKVSGCGDFQFGHRDLWFHPGVRGFEESLRYWGYGDTNLQKKIEMAGYTVIAAPFFPIFHIDHARREGNRMNDEQSSIWDFNETSNSEDWGLANEVFEEICL